MLTATICKPRGAKSVWIFAMAGKDALHGAHHEAQKSTSVTLPAVAGTSPPARLTRPAEASAGKLSPALTSARRPAAPRNKAAIAIGNELLVRSDIVEKSAGLRARAVAEDQAFGARACLDEFDALNHAEDKGRGREHPGLQAT